MGAMGATDGTAAGSAPPEDAIPDDVVAARVPGQDSNTRLLPADPEPEPAPQRPRARLHPRAEIPFYTGRRKPVHELVAALP